MTQKPAALDLVRALGMEAELMTTTPAPVTTHVLIDGQPVPMPAGMMLIFPINFGSFLNSPLLSWQGRLRMLRRRNNDFDKLPVNFDIIRIEIFEVDKRGKS